jgi:phytanoyl-CoA hydroxylase
MGSHAVGACNAAPSDLSAERLPARDTVLMHDGGPGSAICRWSSTSSPLANAWISAMETWTMNHPLHALQDREFGDGRVLFHEMVLVKPPHIGSEKRWHQGAAYFCPADHGLIIGAWIAPEPTLGENGCMEPVPGVQLGGAVSHGHKNDVNNYRIASQHARAAERIAVELQTDDAPIFHALRYQYVSLNASKQHRRAVPYHYYQIDTVWGDVAARRRRFHFADDSYGGCTIRCEPVPPRGYIYCAGLERPIVPIGLLD